MENPVVGLYKFHPIATRFLWIINFKHKTSGITAGFIQLRKVKRSQFYKICICTKCDISTLLQSMKFLWTKTLKSTLQGLTNINCRENAMTWNLSKLFDRHHTFKCQKYNPIITVFSLSPSSVKVNGFLSQRTNLTYVI